MAESRTRQNSLLEFIDNRTSLVFLDETDDSVEKEQTANDTEINPILETSSHCQVKTVSKSNSCR